MRFLAYLGNTTGFIYATWLSSVALPSEKRGSGKPRGRRWRMWEDWQDECKVHLFSQMVLSGTGGGTRELGNTIVQSALLPEEKKADRDTWSREGSGGHLFCQLCFRRVSTQSLIYSTPPVKDDKIFFVLPAFCLFILIFFSSFLSYLFISVFLYVCVSCFLWCCFGLVFVWLF